MHPQSFALVVGACISMSAAMVINGVPPSYAVFSSNFKQPDPPIIKAEFKANWNQHKWNANVSHIASGFIYSSLSQQKVRVDEAYDLGLGSSLFDYTNFTQEGVLNRQWILSPAITSHPDLFTGYVMPAFPLIPQDFLVTNGAVFGGVVNDPYVGEVSTWHLMFQGAIPAKVLIDKNDIIQGYDYWGTEERTYVITRFFNIIIGKIGSEVFDFPSS